VVFRAEKYHLFDVINSQKDHSEIVGAGGCFGKGCSGKGEEIRWSPEERNFWTKNKLLVWVYPGDLSNVNKY